MDKLKFLYLVIFCCTPVFTFKNLDSLKSISVLFRHGDRTPETPPDGLYPNDPYLNYTWGAMGRGGLTNEGKKREYQIGLKLRERYNKFLGEIYRSEDVFVTSTEYERTKMSLLLVLAGLYPPRKEQVWNDNFDWQPIPINSVPLILEGFVDSTRCLAYRKLLNHVKASEEYQKDVSRFHTLMAELSNFTGLEITDTHDIFNLQHTLRAESDMNLELPEWTKDYYPDGLIKDATLFDYKTQFYTTELKKLSGGVLIRKILNDILYNKKRSNKKVNLYSGHESNVGALLHALNIWHNAIPEYGSAVIIELHERDGKNYLKTVYYNSIPPIFETRIIPGCSEYCPLEVFLNVLKDVIPDDVIETCFGPKNNSLLIPKSEDPVAWIYDNFREWYGV